MNSPEALRDELLAILREETGRFREEDLSEVMGPAVDLCSLLSEMIALKREVRANTVASRQYQELMGQALASLQVKQSRAEAEEELLKGKLNGLRKEHREKVISLLIETADRLEDSLRLARRRAKRRGPFRLFKPHKAAVALTEGLSHTLNRVRWRLEETGVTRIPTLDRQFDPELMEALEVGRKKDAPDGRVLEELVAGYRTARRVIRFAQVVVNRLPDKQK